MFEQTISVSVRLWLGRSRASIRSFDIAQRHLRSLRTPGFRQRVSVTAQKWHILPSSASLCGAGPPLRTWRACANLVRWRAQFLASDHRFDGIRIEHDVPAMVAAGIQHCVSQCYRRGGDARGLLEMESVPASWLRRTFGANLRLGTLSCIITMHERSGRLPLTKHLSGATGDCIRFIRPQTERCSAFWDKIGPTGRLP